MPVAQSARSTRCSVPGVLLPWASPPEEGSPSIRVLQCRGGGLVPAPGTQTPQQPDLGMFLMLAPLRASGAAGGPRACHFLELQGARHGARRRELGGHSGAGGWCRQRRRRGPRALPGCHHGDRSGGVEDVAGDDGEGRRGLGEVVNREEHWKGQETRGQWGGRQDTGGRHGGGQAGQPKLGWKLHARGTAPAATEVWCLLRGGSEHRWDQEMPSVPDLPLPGSRGAAGARQDDGEGSSRRGCPRTALARLQAEHPRGDSGVAGTGCCRRGEHGKRRGAAPTGGQGHCGSCIPMVPSPHAHPWGAPWLWRVLR